MSTQARINECQRRRRALQRAGLWEAERSDEAQFWSRVNTSDENGCWTWQRDHDLDGYGRFWRGGTYTRSHRWVWESRNGPVPDGYIVRHTCDNPPCVRPDHLVIGTHKQNADDRDERQRRRPPKGELCGMAKLTWDDVRAIRARYVSQDRRANGVALAREYGVKSSAIYDVVNRKTWRDEPFFTDAA